MIPLPEFCTVALSFQTAGEMVERKEQLDIVKSRGGHRERGRGGAILEKEECVERDVRVWEEKCPEKTIKRTIIF